MDAFDRPSWNLMQTLAWAYLRDRKWVLKTADGVTDHGSSTSTILGGRTTIELSANNCARAQTIAPT